VTESLDGSLDERIVAALCRDGRADVRAVAEAVGSVPTTVQERLESLESRGAIRGYTARIDYEALDYRTAVVRLAVDLADIEAVTTRLRETSAFVTVYETSGPFTVFAVGKFEDEAAIGACLRELHADPNVDGVDCSVASTVRDGGCPLPEG
jgi:DNA-binding Lrp family transcriptional regulator